MAYEDPNVTHNPATGTAIPASWGDRIRENQVDHEGRIVALEELTIASFPSGVVTPFAGSAAPDGWLLCNGAAVSRATYADLFTVLGTTFGVGDGSTTFNLPDLRGRMAVGAGAGSGLTARTLAATGGEEQHALTIGELPSHAHTITHDHPSVNVAGGSVVPNLDYNGVAGGQLGTGFSVNLATGTVDVPEFSGFGSSVGFNEAHENMPPFLVLNYIIKS